LAHYKGKIEEYMKISQVVHRTKNLCLWVVKKDHSCLYRENFDALHHIFSASFRIHIHCVVNGWSDVCNS